MMSAPDHTRATLDPIEAAILGLYEEVASNRDLIMANHEMTQRQLAELNDKLNAIMEHQDVPYKSTGFLSDLREP